MRRALKKPDRKIRLKLPDLYGQGGLDNMFAAGGLADAALPVNRDKVAHLPIVNGPRYIGLWFVR
ncbi:hypothetical protein AGR4A_pAt30028 [Agrobacterium tumefaciens str. B6]|uniref:Uncharacterized protein n=1 Tax=Agrobacterium tumefaciens str. B6 TaxID=1183423 RepID=A0A822VDN5_AGRTU|nr:hypothetical protein AGR4A_pAt30028 [Agrobacterium tumefaciens str. B6]